MGRAERQGGRLGAIGLGVDSRQDDQGAVQRDPKWLAGGSTMTEGSEAKGTPRPFTDEARALGIDVGNPDTLAWMGEHLPEWRQQASGQRPLYWILGIGFVVGLAAQIVGFLLKTSVTTEPLLLVADLLYALGWSLWTGVVVAFFVQIWPEAKRRQLKRSLDAYEAALRDKARAGATRRRGTTERRRRGSGQAERPEGYLEP
jgi:hypothetical protein